MFGITLVFIKSGLGSAYIQKKDADETDASTIFYFNIFVSLLFYLLFWFSAPYISNFYDDSRLTDLIRVSSSIIIINSFGLMQNTKLVKNVDFKKKSLIQIVSILISGIGGISLAYSGFGVWSLVFQKIAQAGVFVIGLWLFYSWRPKLIFNFDALKSMFSYGSWILLVGILREIFNNIYILVIGKFYPMADLGFYSKAKSYQKLISQQPTLAITLVAFPFFRT